jgi:hypothetical protein
MYYTTHNKPTQIPYELIDKAIVHATNFLDIKNADLNISFKRLGGVAANVDYFKEENTIDMEIDSEIWRYKDEFERTIFHEFVHAKQIMDGRLNIDYPSKWYGVEYNCSYFDLPWEKEAYTLEEEMMKSFKTVDIHSESL